MSTNNELLIPTFLEAAITETMQVQVSTAIKVKKSMVAQDKEDQLQNPSLDVVSLMGIKSSAYTGSFALAFPKATFLNVLESMIGEKHAQVTSQNTDACSELLNIIYASARVKINEAGFDFQPAIPATICGKELWFPVAQFKQFIRFDCESEKGNFLLAFALRRISGA
jgi:CheY-specific phosphatase CheX